MVFASNADALGGLALMANGALVAGIVGAVLGGRFVAKRTHSAWGLLAGLPIGFVAFAMTWFLIGMFVDPGLRPSSWG